jgi:hypothetical protein
VRNLLFAYTAFQRLQSSAFAPIPVLPTSNFLCAAAATLRHNPSVIYPQSNKTLVMPRKMRSIASGFRTVYEQ